MTRPFLLLSGLLALAACQPAATPSPADPLAAAVSGRTLVADGGEFLLGSDGTLTGRMGPNRDTPVDGTWEVRTGQFCRTLSAPPQLAGTACQQATLNGDGTVTIVGVNGPVTYAIR